MGPWRFRVGVADAIGKATKKWVAAAQPKAGDGIAVAYFRAAETAAPVADADLHE